MKDYIVSARKYRPMSFGGVVGQAALTTTLRNAVRSGKLAHAYLFCGPRGVGKTTCARIFAKAINCEHPTADGEACNKCESCTAFNEQRSYNIFELDAASNNSVENIKSLMEQTRIPPQVGRYKVFIIDEVHMLSTQAFNAFLKTLEEPPAHVIFILATTEKHKILPTIISRCQIYDFERMTVGGIISHLEKVARNEGIECEEEALALIAEKADGGMRDALSIFDQAAAYCQGKITCRKVTEDLNVLDTENYFNIIDLAVDNKVAEILLLVNNIMARGFDGGNLINGLAKHVRNVLVAKDERTIPLLEASGRRAEKYRAQAAKCPATFLYKALRMMNDCDINYRQSNDKRLLVELTLIEMAQIIQGDGVPAEGIPHERLKPVFNKPAENEGHKTARTTPAEGKGSGTVAQAGAGTAGKKPDSRAGNMPQRPARKLGAIGISLAEMRKQGNAPSEAGGEKPVSAGKGGDKPFDNNALHEAWMAVCGGMPQDMRVLAVRIKDLEPVISAYPEVEVAVGSQALLDDVERNKSAITSMLAEKLQNSSVTLNVKLAPGGGEGKVLSRGELLEKMKEENPLVRKLCSELGLEIV